MTATIPDDASLNTLAAGLGQKLLARGEMIGTAESCTGGLIAKLMTDIAGSSGWFERGIVSYSNEAKQDLLGVSSTTLATHGAVSASVVLEMVQGLLRRAPVEWTLAVSGIAGPDGGTPQKPVGLVVFAKATRGNSEVFAEERQFEAAAGATLSRAEVRRQALLVALELLLP